MEKYSRIRRGKWQSHYSEEFKQSVCDEYLKGNGTIRSLEKKYGIGKCSINAWLLKYGYEIKKVFLQTTQTTQTQNTINTIENTAPIWPIIEPPNPDLRKQLEDALIQLEGYKRMIELAEQDFNIPIRKKYNTK